MCELLTIQVESLSVFASPLLNNKTNFQMAQSMKQTINILHLTDIHIKSENKEDVKLRIDALIKYLISEDTEIDLIAITGDLAFSGDKDQYRLFEEFVVAPIKKYLRVSDSKILIVPGNHDVSRKKASMEEHQRVRKLKTSREAENEIRKISKPWDRLAEFQQYQENYSPRNKPDYQFRDYGSGLYSTRKYLIKGVNVGVACLNTAWLCIDDDDCNLLFLSELQIRDSIEGLNNCNLRICLCHHPSDWLHPSESELSVIDLKREFQLILTGHLHCPISVSQIDTNSNSLNLTGRAFFEGKIGADVDDGFHIYKINAAQGTIIAQFRRYIRKRNTYDKDTEHAQDGEHSFNLPIPLAVQPSTALIAQRLSSSNLLISKEIHSTLSQLQGTENPVFITPKIRIFKLKNGVRKTVKDNLSISELFGKNVIICGGQDSGKTILLKTIVSECEKTTKIEARLLSAVYLSVADIPKEPNRENILASIESKLDFPAEEAFHVNLTIAADSVSSKPSEFIKNIKLICDEYGWTFVVSIGNVIADVLVQEPEYSDTLFVEVLAWGPSRIREFARKLFNNTNVNSELAYKFVSDCLRIVDLPATPTVVSLYMSIFPKVGCEISSLSFLRLLEKIEQTRLGSNESTTVDSLYNRRKILQRMAVHSLETNDLYMERDIAVGMVTDFFCKKKLPVSPELFINNLVDSGILRFENELIGFSHFVFFDYYLALSFKDKIISASDYTGDVQKCARVAYALSLFAGLERENLELASNVMNTVESRFHASSELRLKDLDAHISALLMTENRQVRDADKVATENLENGVDYDQADEEYERQKKAVSRNREELLRRGVDSSASELSIQIDGLHAFYSIFKNLENIDGEWKELLLDRILDYHITTNFSLIDFSFQFSKDEKFRTFAAYMLTWTGHGFMSSSLGNPTLCSTICEVIESTKNDFKQFLLLLLLSDLRDSRALGKIGTFVANTESRAATEILYIHVRNRLVDYEEREIPVELVSLFKSIFIKRQSAFGGAKGSGVAKAAFNNAMKEVKIEHWQHYRDLIQNRPSDEGDLLEV